MTHRDALSLISQYQATGDEKIFAILLAKYDELLLKTLYDYQRLKLYMRKDPLQELYHIAITGFHDAVKKIPSTEKPYKIPAWIVSYVKHAFDNSYRAEITDKALFKRKSYVFTDTAQDRTSTYNSVKNNMDVEVFLKCKRLTTDERKILKLYYLKDMKLADVSNEMTDCTTQRVHYLKDRALKKLKDCSSGNYNCTNKLCTKRGGCHNG